MPCFSYVSPVSMLYLLAEELIPKAYSILNSALWGNMLFCQLAFFQTDMAIGKVFLTLLFVGKCERDAVLQASL